MTSFTIRVGQEGEFSCAPDQSLLRAMERAGRSLIAVGCRGGGCGACKVHIRAGRYRCGKMSRLHVTAEEQAAGYALSCRVYPETDLELVPLHHNKMNE